MEPTKKTPSVIIFWCLFVWHCKTYDIRFYPAKIKHKAFIEYYLEGNREYSFVTEEEILFRELEEVYKNLIQDLPERRREIFVLSRQNGLTYKEIAEKLNISENTVDTQIRNALTYLRSKITQQ
ncbi:MAG: sigma-70 family RNA polymerase sigma factor [Chloroflexia bacterium]|nr:sigma-70 family RNA polymerase sigma factor [Chloroflexia bacterium]